MRTQDMSLTVATGYLVVLLLAFGGWIANIVKIAGSSFDPLTAMPSLRVIGVVVPPLGAVLGYV